MHQQCFTFAVLAGYLDVPPMLGDWQCIGVILILIFTGPEAKEDRPLWSVPGPNQPNKLPGPLRLATSSRCGEHNFLVCKHAAAQLGPQDAIITCCVCRRLRWYLIGIS